MRRRVRRVLRLLVLGAILGATLGGADCLSAALPGPAGIIDPAAGAPAQAVLTVAGIATRRVELQKEIAATRAELAKLPEDASADAARWLTQETALLERIDAIYAEQERTWQQAADLATEAAAVEERTRNRRPAEATFKPPYDLALLDQLYNEQDALKQAAVTLKRDVNSAETALQEARDILGDKDRERRALRSSADDPDAADKTPDNLRLAALESRLAQETLLLREKALKTLKLQQSLLAPKQLLLRPRIDWLLENLALGPEPAAGPPSPQSVELDQAIAAAKKEAEKALQAAIATERRPASVPPTDELEARRAIRQIANLTVSVLTAQRERLAEVAAVTALRRRVLTGGMSSSELRVLARENQENLDQLSAERRRKFTDLIRSRRELQDWQGRLAQAAATDEKAPPWRVECVKRLSAWIGLSQTELAGFDHLRTEHGRLQEEIGARVTLFSWREALAWSRENALLAWNFEVFAVQDQPVRVKTILLVLLLVLLGYYASHWLSAQVSNRVFKRLGLNTGRRAAWQALWFYAMFIVVLVVAFNQFHLSLTQFSVVSGALAVGIGFGSQSLINNFISGIILLIERPVNQGDVIEIDGRRVTVERLGARSTIVLTLDNTHIIVPNSRLLEQPVINWTLSDEVVRQQIRVGVAYGSPTRKVEELLHGIMAGVAHVRKEPRPLVIFADFGDSALLFDIFFWATIAERLDTENELRHRIAEEFARAAIVIAFPQRDVHLDTAQPLQVVLTPTVRAGPEKQDAPK